LFADDTSVTVTDKDHDSFKQKTNLALTSLNLWFYINQLVLNIAKTNVIKFTPKITAHVPLDIYYLFGKTVSGIFCDLEKAFECANHDILSSKLELYRVWGKINDFMKSYFKTDIR